MEQEKRKTPIMALDCLWRWFYWSANPRCVLIVWQRKCRSLMTPHKKQGSNGKDHFYLRIYLLHLHTHIVIIFEEKAKPNIQKSHQHFTALLATMLLNLSISVHHVSYFAPEAAENGFQDGYIHFVGTYIHNHITHVLTIHPLRMEREKRKQL